MDYNRRSIRFITPPSTTAQVIKPAEVKEWLKLDACDDVLIAGLISAATIMMRNYLWRAVAQETIELILDHPGGEGYDETRLGDGVHTVSKAFALGTWGESIDLPYPVISSIVSIKSFDTTNTETTFSSANYQLDGDGGRVYLNQGASWPVNLRDRAAMKIRYVAGWAPADVPADLKVALLRQVAHMYECRQACDIAPDIKLSVAGYKLFDYMGIV